MLQCLQKRTEHILDRWQSNHVERRRLQTSRSALAHPKPYTMRIETTSILIPAR